ncbi:MAG: hypothetical protein WA740_08450 [Candidatus Binataceae bacterium]
MNRTKSISSTLRGALKVSTLAAAIMIAAAGCSDSAFTMARPNDLPPSSAQSASAKPAPPPNILDCGIVSIGSPSKYACDGKVYTSRQITQMRADWSDSQKSEN